jgi:hypothetical protein
VPFGRGVPLPRRNVFFATEVQTDKCASPPSGTADLTFDASERELIHTLGVGTPFYGKAK